MCLVLTEEQENRILEIAYAVDNKLEEGTFYRYSGPAAQRSFCKIMLALNKLYTRADINVMSFQGLNSDFAKKGTNKYSIFKYRGGANCKHVWREILVGIDEDGLPYEIDKGVVDDSAVERLNYSEQTNNNNNKMENDLFEMIFDDEVPGVYGVSLVNDPATGFIPLQFSDDKPAIKIEIKMQSEEKRILVSPVLIPNQRIYRNFKGKGAEVYASAETIEKVQQNFFKQKYQTNSTLEHNKEDIVDGVCIFESWIVEDPEMDKAKSLGFSVPKGTWMVSMKVDNPDIWDNYVKTGLVNGLSIDSIFKLKPIEKIEIQLNKMEKIEQLFKNALKQAQIQLANEERVELKISDELSYFVDKLELDSIVYDSKGVAVPNIEFVYEDKTYKTDENGVINSIEDVIAETEVETEIELSSEQLWSFKGEDGVDYYTSWLSLGQIVYDVDKNIIPSASIEYQGITYGTDENGEIVSTNKNSESPFWKINMAAEEEIAVDDKDAKIAELEAKLADAETKINKLEADLVLKETEAINMSKDKPASIGIVDAPVEVSKSNNQKSTLEVIRGLK